MWYAASAAGARAFAEGGVAGAPVQTRLLGLMLANRVSRKRRSRPSIATGAGRCGR